MIVPTVGVPAIVLTITAAAVAARATVAPPRKSNTRRRWRRHPLPCPSRHEPAGVGGVHRGTIAKLARPQPLHSSGDARAVRTSRVQPLHPRRTGPWRPPEPMPFIHQPPHAPPRVVGCVQCTPVAREVCSKRRPREVGLDLSSKRRLRKPLGTRRTRRTRPL